MAAPSLIFITGGVRSGKSSFAEKMAVDLAKKNGGQLITLQPVLLRIQEMRERIENISRIECQVSPVGEQSSSLLQIGEIAKMLWQPGYYFTRLCDNSIK